MKTAGIYLEILPKRDANLLSLVNELSSIKRKKGHAFTTSDTADYPVIIALFNIINEIVPVDRMEVCLGLKGRRMSKLATLVKIEFQSTIWLTRQQVSYIMTKMCDALRAYRYSKRSLIFIKYGEIIRDKANI